MQFLGGGIGPFGEWVELEDLMIKPEELQHKDEFGRDVEPCAYVLNIATLGITNLIAHTT